MRTYPKQQKTTEVGDSSVCRVLALNHKDLSSIFKTQVIASEPRAEEVEEG